MKKTALAIMTLLTLTGTKLVAQENFTIANHLFYTELLGPGVIMSANFDSRFISNSRTGLGFRIGAGFGIEEFEKKLEKFINEEDYVYSTEDIKGSFYSFPVGINYILGKEDRAYSFEFGAGVTFLTSNVSLYNYESYKMSKEKGYMIGFLTFMYRLAPVDGGISFRVGFTPIIGTIGDLYPMATIGFGYAF